MQLAFDISNNVLPIDKNFNLNETLADIISSYTNVWKDQLDDLIMKLSKRKVDRRMLMVGWNPRDNTDNKYCLVQFYVNEDTLSAKVYQRIGETATLVREDCSYMMLFTYLVAHITGLKPYAFIVTVGVVSGEVKMAMDVEMRYPRLSIAGEGCTFMDVSKENVCLTANSNTILIPAPVYGKCYYPSRLPHEEWQYLDLVQDVLTHGSSRPDRTGVGIKSVFGPELRFSLTDNVLPLLTSKRVFHRGIIEELLWFVRGSTDATELAALNVHIWDANGSRDFLDSLGLQHRAEGDLGPVYGFQWRHFGAEYVDKDTDYSGLGFDQLGHVWARLKAGVECGDSLIVAWNPKDLHLMALPPCHCLVQFMLAPAGSGDDAMTLSCKLYQRSGDLGLGLPFNIASYALLTHMIAHSLGLRPGHFIHSLGDAHAYLNHLEPLQFQLNRVHGLPHGLPCFPTLHFKRQVHQLTDFTIDDFLIQEYHPLSKIAMPFAL